MFYRIPIGDRHVLSDTLGDQHALAETHRRPTCYIGNPTETDMFYRIPTGDRP